MDALAGLLEGPRARGAFLMRSLLDPPWSLRVEDQAPLTIAALRSWLAREDAPAWYRAYRDPQVGTALRLIENNPAHPWTVGSLAAEVGLSRAALARRFTQLVGEPPMALLTEIRLALATDLLRGSDATIETVARRVGYSTAFALSTAIKRRYGMSPKAIRAEFA
nr:AraC family transcriptional regulator [Mycolicibacterium llatzerense]